MRTNYSAEEITAVVRLQNSWNFCWDFMKNESF